MPIPAHERCTLTAAAIELVGHIDGIALRFGPGPEVAIFQPCLLTAMRHHRWAGRALLMLSDCLAKTETPKEV